MVMELAQLRIPGLIIKWQLFKHAGNNIPLDPNVFDAAYHFAMTNFGIPTTASVFDKDSLDFLLNYNVPFVKIANSPASKDMLFHIDDKINTVNSCDTLDHPKVDNSKFIYCISKYPATMKEYEDKFGDKLHEGISDHTINFDMFNKYQPKVYEFHFKIDDTTGLDAGDFARTPDQIRKWLKPKKIDLAEVLRTAE
jgi:sialic acid synthase SpsE